ncbi:MAG: hypothetical protein IJO56_06345 [Oscillospiraceae bacterium]|nr:hypothetical protein [Oscillospiraceae bacterium]
MQYVIRMKLRCRGQCYFFSHFQQCGDGVRAVNVMMYRAEDLCKKYPSIKAACEDVKLIDRKKWRPVIVLANKPVWKGGIAL